MASSQSPSGGGSQGDTEPLISRTSKSLSISKSSRKKFNKYKRRDSTPPATPNFGGFDVNSIASATIDEPPRSSMNEPERPSTPPSPPLLLSTGGGQDSLGPDADSPGRYTIADMINMNRSGQVTFPIERQLTPGESTVSGFPFDYSNSSAGTRNTIGSNRPLHDRVISPRGSASELFTSCSPGSPEARRPPRSISELRASVSSGLSRTNGSDRPASELFTSCSPGSPEARRPPRSISELRASVSSGARTNVSDRPISEVFTPPSRSIGSTRTRPSVNRLMAQLHAEAFGPGSMITKINQSRAMTGEANPATRDTFQSSNPGLGPILTRTDLDAAYISKLEMADARLLVEDSLPLIAKHFEWDNNEFVDMMGEGHALAKHREIRLAQGPQRKHAKERKRVPNGWTPETSKPTTFHRFMQLKDMQDLHPGLMKYMMGFMLVLQGEDVVPYHYVEGKVLRDADGGPGEVREKPNTNLLIALASSRNTKGRMPLDDAQNILFRNNRFSFRNPRDLIMFMDAIGSTNMLRLQNESNIVVKRTFFSTKYKNTFEMKWLARWSEELRSQMLGLMVVTPDWDILQEDLDYEGPVIEAQLKIVVQAMKEANEMENLLGKSPREGTPMRIQSLDLGEAFSRVTDPLGAIGLAAKGDSQAEELINSEDEAQWGGEEGRAEIESSVDELISEARFGKAKGRADTPDLDYDDNELVGRLGKWYLDDTLPGASWDGTFLDGDDQSVDSGWYPPSIIDDYCEVIQDTSALPSCSPLPEEASSTHEEQPSTDSDSGCEKSLTMVKNPGAMVS